MYKNQVFAGCGVCGTAYVGSNMAMERAGLNADTERIAGTSAGAIFAMLKSFNFTAKEIFDIFATMDFASFAKNTLCDDIGMIRDYGIHSTGNLEAWIKHVITMTGLSPIATFKEARGAGFKDLTTLAVSYNTESLVYHNYENTPNVSIADAVVASASIPWFFKAKNINGELFCDGGTQKNFPIEYFDVDGFPNPETIGFHLGELGIKPAQTPLTIGHPKEAFLRLFGADRNSQMADLMSEPQNTKRTVFISDCGISPINFDIQFINKAQLLNTGIRSTIDFIK